MKGTALMIQSQEPRPQTVEPSATVDASALRGLPRHLDPSATRYPQSLPIPGRYGQALINLYSQPLGTACSLEVNKYLLT